MSQELGELNKGGPSLLPTVTEQGTTEGEHGLSAGATPAHASLFHALLDDDLAGGFNGATANGIASLTKEAIAHTVTVDEEVSQGLTHFIRQRCSSWIEQADLVKDVAQVGMREALLLSGHPGFGGIGGEAGVGNRP